MKPFITSLDKTQPPLRERITNKLAKAKSSINSHAHLT